jgi:hypothetical protein
MDMSYSNILRTSEYHGTNPRDTFGGHHASVFFSMYYKLQEETSSLPTSSHFIWSMYSVQSGSRISPHLFQIYSTDDHLFSNCLVRPVTDMALGYYLSQYKKKLPAGPRKLYKLLKREPKLASTSTYVFRWGCNEFFQSFKEPRSFTVRSLDKPRKSTTWRYPGKKTDYMRRTSLSSQLQDQIKSGNPGRAIPTSSAFPTFDYIVYTLDGLEFVQISRGVDCSGGTAGFERVQRWLNRNGQDSQHILPSKKQPWKLIFVVPEETAPSFKKWTFGDGWDGKVVQYVLGLSQQQIWRR